MFRETDPIPSDGGSAIPVSSLVASRPRALSAIDLGGRVGLRDWLRGTATLYGAIAALIAVSPGVVPLPAVPLPRPVPVPVPAPVAEPRPHASPRPIAIPALPELPDRARGEGSPLRIAGLVGFSLYRAARLSGVPLPVVADYLRAIGARVDIADIRATDRFDIILATPRGTERARLLLAGLVHDGKRFDLVPVGKDWYDADGLGPRRDGDFAPPVYGRLTSGFGMRVHPLLGFGRMHQGVDLAAPFGSPVAAASAGTVRYAGWHGGHGNYVLVDHGGGLTTGYGHLSRIVVTPGAMVRQGELLGSVGMTGLATGPHLHFEVLRGGVPVDPATARFATAKRAPPADATRVRAAITRLTAVPARAAVLVASR